MPDSVVVVNGNTVTISGKVTAGASVTAMFEMGTTILTRTVVAGADGNVAGSIDLANGTWTVAILWGNQAESCPVTIPGGGGPEAVVVGPHRIFLHATNLVSKPEPYNTLKKKANMHAPISPNRFLNFHHTRILSWSTIVVCDFLALMHKPAKLNCRIGSEEIMAKFSQLGPIAFTSL